MKIAGTLKQCLDDLQRRIDERQEQNNLAEWTGFVRNHRDDGYFTPTSRKPAPPLRAWPKVTVNQAIADYEAMLLHQFSVCSDVLTGGKETLLCVRCNYGTGILASVFGCELFMMDEATQTLPTVRPLGSRDRVKALLDKGLPDIRAELCGKALEAASRFQEVLAAFPVLGRHITLYHPDLQGPMDVAEMIWGSDIFYAFYDDAPLLRDFLNLITETYAAVMRAWFVSVPPSSDCATHWGLLHKGRLMIRDDSLMNLSPQTYVDFVRPLDQRLFDEFGGGAIHFCGRAEHYIEPMSQMRGLTMVHMSQPELNDMEAIFRNTVDKGINVTGFNVTALRKALGGRTRPLRGRVACFLE